MPEKSLARQHYVNTLWCFFFLCLILEDEIAETLVSTENAVLVLLSSQFSPIYSDI